MARRIAAASMTGRDEISSAVKNSSSCGEARNRGLDVREIRRGKWTQTQFPFLSGLAEPG
jgi:hypothetical protein